MDVNVIFNNIVSLDEKKNFIVNFKNEEEIVSVLLNKKKDYFIVNGIIYINDVKNDKKDTDIAKVKKLEEEAEKHIEMVKNNKFDTTMAKNFFLSFGEDYLISSFKPTYYFKLEEKEMKDFLKTYKYYNIKNQKIENFAAYILFTHLVYGTGFVLDKKQKLKPEWPAPPIDRINFKLSQDETKVIGTCRNINTTYVENIYSWANKFVIIDSLRLRLVTSSTGWLKMFSNLSKGRFKYSTLRAAFAAYFLERKNDIFFHMKTILKI